MNIAHPFREGSGRSNGIMVWSYFKNEIKESNWLGKGEEEDYLLAMRSPIKDTEIKYILNLALTDEINSHEVYMKGMIKAILWDNIYI